MGALTGDTAVSQRRRFNPARQLPPGGPPQIIMPPAVQSRGPVQLALVGAPRTAEQVPPPPPPPPDPPAEDPAPEDPPNTP